MEEAREADADLAEFYFTEFGLCEGLRRER